MTPWIQEGKKYLGMREVPGSPTAPAISRWLSELKAWWNDDETPWCGTAVAAWMTASGIKPPKEWYRARAWASWGSPLMEPVAGAVVVFERTGGGHVGIVTGVDQQGRLMVLGGNQGNAVSIAPFDRSRVVAYRWPTERIDLLLGASLPVVGSNAASSKDEA